MNAKQEFIRLIEGKGVLCVNIVYGYTSTPLSLAKGFTSSEFLILLNRLDFEYNNLEGDQWIYGTVWFTDGTWADRGEYDGNEWWDIKECPKIPQRLKTPKPKAMIKEKIISITDTFIGNRKDGYLIKTTEQDIKLGIDNDQCCCETFGYFMSEDDLDYYIGSDLYSIEVTDIALKTFDILEDMYEYEGAVMFVNIKTSLGLLQFVAYNDHNGYYGHEACVISKQLNYTTTL